MSEKPQKRLVSKGRYAWMVAGRTVLLSSALLLSLAGITLLCRSVALRQYSSSESDIGMLVAVSGGMFLLAAGVFCSERKVERVTPITKHTTSSLPPEESLVRASNAPPSQQQAELLRAAQYGKETPAEELLRAGVASKKDV